MNATSRMVQTIQNCRAVHSLDLLLLIVKCPFDKITIYSWPMIALCKSFQLIYCNTHLNSHETVPLSVLLILPLQSSLFSCLSSNSIISKLLSSSLSTSVIKYIFQYPAFWSPAFVHTVPSNRVISLLVLISTIVPQFT